MLSVTAEAADILLPGSGREVPRLSSTRTAAAVHPVCIPAPLNLGVPMKKSTESEELARIQLKRLRHAY